LWKTKTIRDINANLTGRFFFLIGNSNISFDKYGNFSRWSCRSSVAFAADDK
jgi:hypothetical protein